MVCVYIDVWQICGYAEVPYYVVWRREVTEVLFYMMCIYAGRRRYVYVYEYVYMCMRICVPRTRGTRAGTEVPARSVGRAGRRIAATAATRHRMVRAQAEPSVIVANHRIAGSCPVTRCVRGGTEVPLGPWDVGIEATRASRVSDGMKNMGRPARPIEALLVKRCRISSSEVDVCLWRRD